MRHKIGIVIGIIAAVIAVGLTFGILHIDRVASETADRQLRAVLSERGLPVTWSAIHIRVGQGTIRIDSLRMYLQTELHSGRDSAYVLADVPRVDIGRIHWIRLLRERHLHIDEVALNDIDLAARSAEAVVPMLLQATQDSVRRAMPIARVSIDAIHLKNSHVVLSEAGGHLLLEADSLQAGVHHISYHLSDSSLQYCDSVYHLSLRNVRLTTPDGLLRATCKQIETADAGGVVLRSIRFRHIDPKERHAYNSGRQPATWLQGTLHEIRTTPVNLVRTAVNRQLTLAGITIAGDSIYLFRDNHYKPLHPYPMPQEQLQAIPIPFHVGKVGVSLRALTAEMTGDSIHAGQFLLERTDVTLSPLTNQAGEHVKADITSHLPEQGTIRMNIGLTLNTACEFTLNTEAETCRLESFNRFVRPLVGVETSGPIQRLELSCKGDNRKSEGDFCMQYDSLKIHVIKDEGTITQLSKFAGLINMFAPTVLRTHNPRSRGDAPQRYNVTCTRDPWKLFPIYLIASPLSDGILQTVLPSGLEKTVKEKQQKIQK